MPTLDPAILNLGLDALMLRVREAFSSGNYTKRLVLFERFAPTVPDLLAGSKAGGFGGGAYYQWAEQHPMRYAGTRQQGNVQVLGLYVVTQATKQTQERVGIELLADLETIAIGSGLLNVVIPSTGKSVPFSLEAKGQTPINANAIPELAGGHILLAATFRTALGNPRRQPGGAS